MENSEYYSSLLYGVDNECEIKEKYTKVIDSINGLIGIKKCYDSNTQNYYYEVYLNDDYVCDVNVECSDKEIENIVENNVCKIQI